MKKTKLLIIGLAALLLAGVHVGAQTFGGGLTITGTTNAVLSGVPTTYAYFNLPPKVVNLSNITSTNETVIFSYGFTVSGNTNPVILASVTNSFASGTNGGSWSYTNPAVNLTPQILPWAQVQIGAFTNTVYVP